MKMLSEMVGEEIVASIPFLHQTAWQSLKLLAVEPNGLWVQSHKFNDDMMRALKVQAAPKTAVFFIPFHQIKFIMSSLDSPSLRDDAFGV